MVSGCFVSAFYVSGRVLSASAPLKCGSMKTFSSEIAGGMSVKKLLAVAAVLSSTIASAQAEPLPQRMYLNPGILIGSSRMIALGGAYTGIGESAYGTSANIASIATRTPTENGPWQLSPVFTYMLNFGEYDFDNDNRNDEAIVSGQYLAGAQLRIGRLGIGAFLRTNHLSFCVNGASCNTIGTDPNKIDLVLTSPTLSVGYSFLDENLVVAAGLYGVIGEVTHELKFWSYRGIGPELGLLVRPKGMPFRVGINARPEIGGGYQGGADQTVVVGRTIYNGVVSPGVYSFGTSFKIGEGAFSYNNLPPIDAPPPSRALDARNPFIDMVRNRDDAKTGRLLVTMQVDIITPVRDAVSINAFIRNGDAPPIGERVLYTPRIGLEHLTFPGRFKTRLGGYLEASPFAAHEGRLHVTGGTELFLIRLIDDWAATFTFDVARKYYNFGFSVGTWR